MSGNITKGRFGEQAACDMLVSEGYRIIERNWYTEFDEIDIIAENGAFIVFAEVKARRNDESSLQYGRPASAVGRRKKDSVAYAAKEYLFKHKTELQPRFDVIEIYFSTFKDINGETWYRVDKTEHIENAFAASSRVRYGSKDRRLL